MNVLSLFDGMGCGMIALIESGIKVDKYYASEIDKHAIKQTQLNFKDVIHLGDITKVHYVDGGFELQRESGSWIELGKEKIDLVIAGSPCQGFSKAGKMLNFDDPRSKLFFEFIRLLRQIKKQNPNVKFLLENVEMKKWCLKVISDELGVFPIKINSKLVSAQNRERYYWSNINTINVGFFDETYTYVGEIKDRGILIKDIKETEKVDEKYYLSDKLIHFFDTHAQKTAHLGQGFGWKPHQNLDRKANCLTTRSGQRPHDNFLVEEKEQGKYYKKNFKEDNEKANCLLSQSYKGNQANGMTLVVAEATQKGFIEIQDGEFFDLTFPNSDTRRGRKMEDKCNTLMAGQQAYCLWEGKRIRRLTPKECARLQTVPNWYKWGCSDTQIYKMLGNGWTIEVIKEFFKYLCVK